MVDDPAQLGLDLGLPAGVTISRLFQGMRGPSSRVLVDVRGADGADLRCPYLAGGLSAAEQQAWLLDMLHQVRINWETHPPGGNVQHDWVDAQESDLGTVRRETVERLCTQLLLPVLKPAGIGAVERGGMLYVPNSMLINQTQTLPIPYMLQKCIRLAPVCVGNGLLHFDQYLRPVLSALQLSAPQQIEVTIVDLDPISKVGNSYNLIWFLHKSIVAGEWRTITTMMPGLERFWCSLPPSIVDRLFPFPDRVSRMTRTIY